MTENIAKESCFQNNTQVLQENLSLELLATHSAWWYSLFGQDNDKSILAYLFDVTNIDLHALLVSCGWVVQTNSEIKKAPKFSKNGFESFRSSHKMDIECDKYSGIYYVRVGTFRQ